MKYLSDAWWTASKKQKFHKDYSYKIYQVIFELEACKKCDYSLYIYSMLRAWMGVKMKLQNVHFQRNVQIISMLTL